MISVVKVGDRIVAIDSGRELVVTGLVNKKFVESGEVGFDFIATHFDREFVTGNGNAVTSDRAFKYSENNFKKFVE